MGRFFTVLADMKKIFVKSMPRILRYVFYLSYPLIDLLIILDNLNIIKNHSKFGKYHSGYFMILRR